MQERDDVQGDTIELQERQGELRKCPFALGAEPRWHRDVSLRLGNHLGAIFYNRLYESLGH